MSSRCRRPIAAALVAFGFTLSACNHEATSPAEADAVPEIAAASAQAALAFRQVSAFSGHTCGVTTSDQAYCWGYNVHGQIGDGTKVHPRLRPVAVAGGHHFRQVSAGVWHTCGVTTSNQAYCWGENRFGRLGDGTTTERLEPVAVAGGLSFREVANGANHTCGLSLNGTAYCWGQNGQGQLGDGTLEDRATPAPVVRTLRFRHLTAGSGHTCGVATNDRIFCWGNNRSGELGVGSAFSFRAEPTRVSGPYSFSQVGAGNTHTCGVTLDHRIYCWGDNSYGALGHGTEGELRFTPVVVVGDFRFDAVEGGIWHTCGITSSDRLKCWGGNESGALGNGTFTNRSTPGASAGDLRFRQVVGAGDYTCGVTPDHQGYCWGTNSAGQLGDGTTDGHPRPTPIAGPS